MRSTKAFIAGAGVAYLLDPAHGRQRRRAVVGRIAQIGSGARGLLPRSSNAPGAGAVDDSTALELIRREALLELGITAEDVSVSVEDGVATIRGELASASVADDLVRRVGTTPGVRDVAAMLRISGDAGDVAA
jgi:osmotically-inducible protein OsmY